MTPSDDRPEAPEEPSSRPSTPVYASKPRQAFSKTRRELSEEELAQSGAQKLLLEEVYRLDEEVSRLSDYRDRFHEKNTEVAVLREKRRKSISWGIVSSACLVVGAALIGLVPNFWKAQPAAGIVLGAGILLVGAGILAQAYQQWT